MFTRQPVVAGQFYEYSQEDLEKQIGESFLNKKFGPGKLPKIGEEKKIIGLIVPHAGYIYSGSIAANAYFHLAQDKKSETFTILGPNHTGMGHPFSIVREGLWKTPLGKVEIDKNLAEKILSQTDVVEEDVAAHMYEHSIEVQLPFLQYVYKKIKFVPICMMSHNYDVCDKLSDVLSLLSKTIIASSDFTHFTTNEIAHKQDEKAIQSICQLNTEKFLEIIDSGVSICGPGPIATLMLAAKKLKAKGELIKYATSGDVVGSKDNVVGYAAIKFVRK